MNNNIRIIKEDMFKVSQWSGGKTTQLFIYPEEADYVTGDFKFRISSATVELDTSTFTKLENVHRYITPLDGDLKLTHNGEDFTNLKPFEIYDFDGNIETTSFGKVQDFNLMLSKGARGSLKSFCIDEKKEIIILTNAGFNILYSYDCLFRISIGEEEFMLHPNEILVMESKEMRNINIQANESSNILLSHIIV